MKKWKPHPPALPNWPDYVRRMYYATCDRIDELRKQVDDNGCVPIPFDCYLCNESRSDFAMVTGDGVPICEGCISRQVAAIEGAKCE